MGTEAGGGTADEDVGAVVETVGGREGGGDTARLTDRHGQRWRKGKGGWVLRKADCCVVG